MLRSTGLAQVYGPDLMYPSGEVIFRRREFRVILHSRQARTMRGVDGRREGGGEVCNEQEARCGEPVRNTPLLHIRFSQRRTNTSYSYQAIPLKIPHPKVCLTVAHPADSTVCKVKSQLSQLRTLILSPSRPCPFPAPHRSPHLCTPRSKSGPSIPSSKNSPSRSSESGSVAPRSCGKYHDPRAQSR
jgi:hypothetical protein